MYDDEIYIIYINETDICKCLYIKRIKYSGGWKMEKSAELDESIERLKNSVDKTVKIANEHFNAVKIVRQPENMKILIDVIKREGPAEVIAYLLSEEAPHISLLIIETEKLGVPVKWSEMRGGGDEKWGKASIK